jgi:hypothetical protein
MDEELISKKELLELKGISYGQLYRWKRKNLIPEEWFIRKSTFTGQETFFPRVMILKRIEKIMDMKEDLSLNDLADVFSPGVPGMNLNTEELIKRGIVSAGAMEIFLKAYGKSGGLDFEGILISFTAQKLLSSGDIGAEECAAAVACLKENYMKFGGKNCELIILRKLGAAFCLLLSSANDIYFESGAKVIFRLSMLSCVEELKLKL